MRAFLLPLCAGLWLVAPSLNAQERARSIAEELVPSYQTLLHKRARELGASIEHMLAKVVPRGSVSAHVSLPDGSRVPLDEIAAPAYVTVNIETPDAWSNEPHVEKLVRALAPELRRAHLSVVVTRPSTFQAQRKRALERVGPFEVASGSAAPLRIALAFMLMSNVALAAILLTRRFKRAG